MKWLLLLRRAWISECVGMQQIRLFFLALSFYTRIPSPIALDYSQLHRSSVYFPVIGWLVGLAAALSFYLTDLVLPQTTAVIMAVIVSIFMTGALHEDGFADVCDGFGGGYGKERILVIMKDSRSGVYAVTGLIMLMSLKLSLLSELSASAVPSMLIAGHSLSRFMPLLLMRQYSYARTSDSKSMSAIHKPSLTELSLAAGFAMLPFFLLPSIFLFAVIPLVLITFMLGAYFNRHIGGYTGDCLGCSQQVSEVCFYLFVSVLWIFI